MTDQDLLDELLLLWEESYEAGTEVPANELCRDFPDLSERVADGINALKRMNWLGQQDQYRDSSRQAWHVDQEPDNHARIGTFTFNSGMEPIPGYRLIEKIGKGAFGEVWSASWGGQKVAIKFFHGDLSVPNSRVRVERELEGLTRIKKVRHPLILEIRSLLVKDDTLMLVTELADLSLETLFTKLRDKVPMVQRCAYALCLLHNVAEALDHLQARHSLLHLDIKPANLLLVKGVCKIGDFGTVFQFGSKLSSAPEVLLSLPSSDDPENIEMVRYGSCGVVPWDKVFRRDATLLTSEGVYTPYYAPPEAFRGKNSRAFDQYSLALTFCDLVAGEIPFKSESQLVARTEGQMELGFLPEPLRSVIAKALAPRPDDRFLSCAAFVDALLVAIEPLVETDKRANNWEGWLLKMEEAAGTKSPVMPADGAISGRDRTETSIAWTLILPLASLLTGGIRAFAFVANKLESLFWYCAPRNRNPTAEALLKIAAIVMACFVLVSIHQNWLSGIRFINDGAKTKTTDNPSRP